VARSPSGREEHTHGAQRTCRASPAVRTYAFRCATPTAHATACSAVCGVCCPPLSRRVASMRVTTLHEATDARPERLHVNSAPGAGSRWNPGHGCARPWQHPWQRPDRPMRPDRPRARTIRTIWRDSDGYDSRVTRLRAWSGITGWRFESSSAHLREAPVYGASRVSGAPTLARGLPAIRRDADLATWFHESRAVRAVLDPVRRGAPPVHDGRLAPRPVDSWAQAPGAVLCVRPPRADRRGAGP
jgi:hypothetical protein